MRTVRLLTVSHVSRGLGGGQTPLWMQTLPGCRHPPPGICQQAGSTHRTGMHTCWISLYRKKTHILPVTVTTDTILKRWLYRAIQLTVFRTHKRSLGQDNVFTGVCLSTGGWGCLPLGPWGVCLWVPGGEGVHTPLGHTPLPLTHTPPPSTSGRYTSYWNAFLFLFCFVLDREGGQSLRACLQIPSPCTCRSKSPSKFNIVPMVTDRLTDWVRNPFCMSV